MATLALTFSDLYKRVSYFLGLTAEGTAPTGNDLTKCKDLVYRGYRRFLYPVIELSPEVRKIYTWSFLCKTGTLSTSIGIASYVLPTNLIGITSGFKFDAGENKDNPVKITMSRLRSLRSITLTNGTPKYYAINMGDYDVTVVAPYYVWFHSPPDAMYNYKYDYIFEPVRPESDNDLFVGGALATEIILECALAEAELQEDDAATAHNNEANKRISAFIEFDKKNFPNADEADTDTVLFVPNFRLAK